MMLVLVVIVLVIGVFVIGMAVQQHRTFLKVNRIRKDAACRRCELEMARQMGRKMARQMARKIERRLKQND